VSVSLDLYMLPGSWRPFAEHVEPLQLDYTTESGAVVVLSGRAHVWHGAGDGVGQVFIESGGGCPAAGLDLWDVSAALSAAVLDRLIGSDTLRGAIERGWNVGTANGGG